MHKDGVNLDNGYKVYRDAVDNVIKKHSNKTAVRYMRNDGNIETFSFRKLGVFFRLVKEIVSKMGLSVGDRAVILSSLSPFSAFTGVALAYCNITVVPIDATLPIEEIEKLIEFSDARVIFTIDSFYNKLSRDVTENILCFDIGNGFNIKAFNSGASLSLNRELVAAPEPDVIAIIYSSGTTGQMKGVEVTYTSAIKAKAVNCRLSRIRSNLSYLCMLPFNHIAGFTSVLTFFLAGCEIDFVEDPDATKLQKAFLTFQPGAYIMVPKVYEVMEQKIKAAVHEKGKAAEFAVNSLMKLSELSRRYFGVPVGRKLLIFIRKEAMGKNAFAFGVGASPCPAETAAFYTSLGVEFENFYASTETNVPLTATSVYDRWSPDSVGKVDRHPEIKVKIRNPDKNGIGEVIVKTELIMKGYFRQPELTKAAFENGWFKTGDYGYIDENGYLHVTGRIKESIVLRNGKKVSPADVDTYYLSRLSDCDIASRGIAVEDGGYDEIHMFVSCENLSADERLCISSKIMTVSHTAPEMYRVSKIHFVPQIKRTAVGKVKRFSLNVSDEVRLEKPENKRVCTDNFTVLQKVENCLRDLQVLDDDFDISPEMSIEGDIGMDSLDVFSLCAELDEMFGISLENCLFDGITVGDIVKIINGESCNRKEESDADRYPLEKRNKDIRLFKFFTLLSHIIYDFRVYGKKNIKSGQQYIFCPNHECHFDGMWTIGCLDDNMIQNICSVAADYLFEKKIYKFGVRTMGGIPVHRTGNSAPVLKRALSCIKNGNHSLLIHPEGTRTFDGKLGHFKNGAAKLSAASGIPIIPVCIDGAFEVFPKTKALPRLFDFKNLRKYPIKIAFGKPISPVGKTEAEIIHEVRVQICKMKRKLRLSAK